MYFTHLPNHRDQTFNEQRHFSYFKKHNVVFHATSGKSYCERHIGCLSLKTVLEGEEWYGVNNRALAVRPGQFLVLNDDQEYSCRIDGPEKTRVVSVFFKNEFASSVFRDASSSEETLLDDPFIGGDATPEFFQTLYNVDDTLRQNLVCLLTTLDQTRDTESIDESLVFLLHHLLREHLMEGKRVGQVRAVKTSTRKEIYERLCVAKDLMHATFMERPTLSSISDVACLSVPQLVRQFKACFQTTPHQYLTQIRLAHAARLLKNTDASLQDITAAIGLENTSAFCRLFKKAYGAQPVRFRKACGHNAL
jgi:AraC family transcriptional regulator